MPYHPNIGQEVVRGTICRDHWVVSVSVLCGDRVPLNEPAPLLVTVDWRRRPDEGTTPDQPADAGGVRLAFRKLSPTGTGEIRFRTDAGALEDHRVFPSDVSEQVLTIVGTAASTGTAPDVMLDVMVEDRPPVSFPMSVGAPGAELAIRAENGTDAPPAVILLEEPVRLRAVPAPAAEGTFRWVTLTPGVEITGERTATAGMTGRVPTPPVYVRPARLFALYAPPGDGRRASMAVLDVELGSTEQAFARFHHLDEAMLGDPAFRARLEAMRPPQVQEFVDRATQDGSPAPVTGYLTRLLEFVTAQEPLRAAPEGERLSITFIMGQGDDFYRAATGFFGRWRDEAPATRRLETGLRTLAAVRQFLEDNPPANDLPWGEVNVVSHADEMGGMEILMEPLGPGETFISRKVNLRTLTQAVDEGRFAALPDNVLDVRSTLRIRGCALGRTQEMLTLLSRAFGGEDVQRPVVRAPRELQTYEIFTRGGQLVSADEFLEEFWFVGFPNRHRPGNAALRASFAENHPDPPVDWTAGMSRTAPRAGVLGDPYVEERTRRFEFTFAHQINPANHAQLGQVLSRLYEDFADWQSFTETSRTATRPDGIFTVEFRVVLSGGGGTEDRTADVQTRPLLRNDAEILDFLGAQPRAVASFQRMGQDFTDYDWTVTNTTVQIDGASAPAVLILGLRTIVRIQRELTEPVPGSPTTRRRAHPPVTDMTRFGEEVPVRPPAHPLGQNVNFP